MELTSMKGKYGLWCLAVAATIAVVSHGQVQPKEGEAAEIVKGLTLKPGTNYVLSSDERAAEAALRRIGTNAIPFLLQELQLAETNNIPLEEIYGRKLRMVKAFKVLGASAIGALPSVKEALFEGPDHCSAAKVLCALGREAHPVLVSALRDERLVVQMCATVHIGCVVNSELEAEALSLLVSNLTAENAHVRAATAGALALFAQSGTSLVEEALKALKKEEHPEARVGLLRILLSSEIADVSRHGQDIADLSRSETDQRIKKVFEALLARMRPSPNRGVTHGQ